MTNEFKARAIRDRVANDARPSGRVDFTHADALQRDLVTLASAGLLVEGLLQSPRFAEHVERREGAEFVVGFLKDMCRSYGVQLQLIQAQVLDDRAVEPHGPPSPFKPKRRSLSAPFVGTKQFRWMRKDKIKY